MFGKKSKDGKKCHSIWDKLLLGVVVGGAVGSILGVALAPDKGSETRRRVRQKIAAVVKKQNPEAGEFQVKSLKKRSIWHKLHDIFVSKK